MRCVKAICRFACGPDRFDGCRRDLRCASEEPSEIERGLEYPEKLRGAADARRCDYRFRNPGGRVSRKGEDQLSKCASGASRETKAAAADARTGSLHGGKFPLDSRGDGAADSPRRLCEPIAGLPAISTSRAADRQLICGSDAGTAGDPCCKRFRLTEYLAIPRLPIKLESSFQKALCS